LPKIYDALEITKDNGQKIILEVQQHLGEDRVRAIAMDSTDGLLRGMPVLDTHSAIKMPVGDHIKGRLLNVVGEAIDGIDKLDNSNGYPIHNLPPKIRPVINRNRSAFYRYQGYRSVRALCKRW